jgi:hypothetical protein
MESNIISYKKLAMNRVEEFIRYSKNRELMRCILTIQSVELIDTMGGISLFKIQASKLNNSTLFWFNYVMGDDELLKYKTGDIWDIVGNYSIDWDDRSIHLYPDTEEQLPQKFSGCLNTLKAISAQSTSI